MTQPDPSTIVGGILDSGRNVRFGKGVVAKTSYIAAAVLVVWGIVAWRWSGEVMTDLGLLIAALIATGFAVWFIKGTQTFAERNPAQAILEGAELLEWHKTELQAKGFPPVSNAPVIESSVTPPPLIGDGGDVQ